MPALAPAIATTPVGGYDYDEDPKGDGFIEFNNATGILSTELIIGGKLVTCIFERSTFVINSCNVTDSI